MVYEPLQNSRYTTAIRQTPVTVQLSLESMTNTNPLPRLVLYDIGTIHWIRHGSMVTCRPLLDCSHHATQHHSDGHLPEKPLYFSGGMATHPHMMRRFTAGGRRKCVDASYRLMTGPVYHIGRATSRPLMLLARSLPSRARGIHPVKCEY